MVATTPTDQTTSTATDQTTERLVTPATIEHLIQEHRRQLRDAIETMKAQHSAMVEEARRQVNADAAEAIAAVEETMRRQLRRDEARGEEVLHLMLGTVPTSVQQALKQATLAADEGKRGYVLLTPRPVYGANERENRKAYLIVDVSAETWMS